MEADSDVPLVVIVAGSRAGSGWAPDLAASSWAASSSLRRMLPFLPLVYAQKCASCHGRQGLGDGDAPRSLLPSPALLAFMIQRPISVDEYLLWSIAEGGKQFDTEMPAFKNILSRAGCRTIALDQCCSCAAPRNYLQRR